MPRIDFVSNDKAIIDHNDITLNHTPLHICHFCGYDLSAHSDKKLCPECGHDIIPAELQISDITIQSPTYFHMLSRGCNLILLTGVICLICLVVILIIIPLSSLQSWSILSSSVQRIFDLISITNIIIFWVTVLCCHSIGILYFTSKNAAGISLLNNKDLFYFRLLALLIFPIALLCMFHNVLPWVSSQRSESIVLSILLPIQLCLIMLFHVAFQNLVRAYDSSLHRETILSFRLLSGIRLKRFVIVSVVIIIAVWSFGPLVCSGITTVIYICIYLDALDGIIHLRKDFSRAMDGEFPS